MPKKALSINFPVERVVLSDLLPFEVPITFSNRHFYKFITDNSISCDENVFKWKKCDDYLSQLILMFLGLPQDTPLDKTIDGEVRVSVDNSDMPSIAFTFPISHKHNEFRYLSVIHPRGQLLAVDFYRKYHGLITYYSSLSPLSLRSAKKIASCTYIDTRSLIESFDDSFGVEVEGESYENLKSFFVYRKYRNIFEFYESDDHHWCEQRFNFLSKLDVSHCFDSVYTHSISWAVFKKKFAKMHLKKTRDSFASKFDRLMQRINYNETNGILIGPELSRIFAEVIMQSIDNDLIDALKNDGLELGKNFQVYRYVDDYFVFYNDDVAFEKIKSALQVSLKTYKLSLNKHKEEKYSRPIITPITIAKKKIARLISDALKYSEDEKNICIHHGSLSTDFKTILSDAGVTYSDVLNYSLAIIERRLKKVLKKYIELDDPSKDTNLVKALVSMVKFTYFIYSVSPKVNSTIKLCRVMQQVILFVNDERLNEESKHVIFKCIFDNSCAILEKCSVHKVTSIETLYVLVLMKQLGKYYWLDEKLLSKYLNIKINDGVYVFEASLNYFSIVSILFYIGEKKRYASIKKGLIAHVFNIFDKKKDVLLNDSEMIHLALDFVACPYVDMADKIKVLNLYKIPSSFAKRIVLMSDCWFTKWRDFNFAKELDSKLSNEVY